MTGSLRGGPVAPGTTLRLVPGERDVRVREVQVRAATGSTRPTAGGPRSSSAASRQAPPERGTVLTADPTVVATSRLLVAIRPSGRARHAGPRPRSAGRPRPAPAPPRHGPGRRARRPRSARGDRPAGRHARSRSSASTRTVAAAPGDRFALRHPSPGSTAGGGVVLDPLPPRGVSRRRLTPERVAAMAGALAARRPATLARGSTSTARSSRLAVVAPRAGRRGGAPAGRDRRSSRRTTPPTLRRPASRCRGPGRPSRSRARRRVTLGRDGGRRGRGRRVARPRRSPTARWPGTATGCGIPTAAPGCRRPTLAAMDRLEAALAVAAPPSLSAAAARDAGCPPDGVRALERDGPDRPPRGRPRLGATTYRGPRPAGARDGRDRRR